VNVTAGTTLTGNARYHPGCSSEQDCRGGGGGPADVCAPGGFCITPPSGRCLPNNGTLYPIRSRGMRLPIRWDGLLPPKSQYVLPDAAISVTYSFDSRVSGANIFFQFYAFRPDCGHFLTDTDGGRHVYNATAEVTAGYTYTNTCGAGPAP
jgi:hypothetical protein